LSAAHTGRVFTIDRHGTLLVGRADHA